MCAGIAGEAVAARPSSCTLRSKICDDAGDGGAGDDDLKFRPGEEGRLYGCEVVLDNVGIPPIPVIGDTGRIFGIMAGFPCIADTMDDVPVGAAVGAAVFFFANSSSFFLPKFQNLRFPVLLSTSEGSLGPDSIFVLRVGPSWKASSSSGTDEMPEPVSLPAALPSSVCLSAMLLFGV